MGGCSLGWQYQLGSGQPSWPGHPLAARGQLGGGCSCLVVPAPTAVQVCPPRPGTEALSGSWACTRSITNSGCFLRLSFPVIYDPTTEPGTGLLLRPWPHLTTSTDAAPDLKKSVESSTSSTLGRIRCQAL
jgi:hypothetical protein